MADKPPPERDEKGRLLPGRAPLNPHGSIPKEIAAVRRQLLEHVPTALAKMVELISSDDPNVARAAAKDILDRTLGKAKETREHTGDANALLVEILSTIRDRQKQG